MSTTHNPVNFEPTDYYVVDYIDNHPPQFWGGSMDAFVACMDQWRKRIQELNVEHGIHRCCHCGNGNVRYVAICQHKPSGRNVCFGSDCVERLNFDGASEFKAMHIRTAAKVEADRVAKYNGIQKTLTDNPGLEEAFKTSKNTFVQDVNNKLQHYGSISPNQIAAVLRAVERDAQRAAEKAKAEPVPTGKRIVFSGVVVSRKSQDGYMPGTKVFKFLVRLDNGSKIWSTEPTNFDFSKYTVPGSVRVKVRATVEASQNDHTFGLAKRPFLLEQETVEIPAK
jgi:hypothetical protein